MGDQKTDPDLLLVWIRNGFAKAGLVMPCFDLALAPMWQQARGEEAFPSLVNPWLGRSTTAARGGVSEGADKASEWVSGETATELVGDAIGHIPGVGFVLKRLGSWIIDKGNRAYLHRTRDHLQRL